MFSDILIETGAHTIAPVLQQVSAVPYTSITCGFMHLRMLQADIVIPALVFLGMSNTLKCWLFKYLVWELIIDSIFKMICRNNPAARNRLVPWLNRELNALLRENTEQVMHLVDDILDMLLTYNINSRHFRNVLTPYLTHKTGHFIHEFYNFMRSPFDMVGYDRIIIYDSRTMYTLSDQVFCSIVLYKALKSDVFVLCV